MPEPDVDLTPGSTATPGRPETGSGKAALVDWNGGPEAETVPAR
ncbi:MAG TPA: hypothetical protein VH414_09590 [Lichenihabitans sp.]|nr:hypothetical protein [Lichenihabitans sp.]